MKRLQHQSVAAERHHDISVGGRVITISRDKLRKRRLGFGAGTGDKGDPIISLWLAHEHGSHWRGKAVPPWVVYTTLAVLVEIIGYARPMAQALVSVLSRFMRFQLTSSRRNFVAELSAVRPTSHGPAGEE
jgi:hypothetical protein